MWETKFCLVEQMYFEIFSTVHDGKNSLLNCPKCDGDVYSFLFFSFFRHPGYIAFFMVHAKRGLDSSGLFARAGNAKKVFFPILYMHAQQASPLKIAKCE